MTAIRSVAAAALAAGVVSLAGTAYAGQTSLEAVRSHELDDLLKAAAGRSEPALAEITRVVNSSLELDEVLRIVMDTIVRLTGAERGFLMLHNEVGELVIRIARARVGSRRG